MDDVSRARAYGPAATVALAFGLVALGYLVEVGMLLAVAGLGGDAGSDVWAEIGLIAFQITVIEGLVWLARHRAGEGYRDLLALRRVPLGRPVFYAAAIAAVTLGDAVMMALVPTLAEAWTVPRDPTALAAFALATLVGAPVSEELLYRGFLHTSLRRHWRLLPTLLVTAALFALLHWGYGWAYVVMVFPSGILLGWMRERSGSIWPSMALHAALNLLSLVSDLASRVG